MLRQLKQKNINNQFRGFGSGIRCLFDPESGKGFFRIPDLGSWIPNLYFESLMSIFGGKKGLCKLAQIFFFAGSKIKLFSILRYLWQRKKVRQLIFCCCFWIWDPGYTSRIRNTVNKALNSQAMKRRHFCTKICQTWRKSAVFWLLLRLEPNHMTARKPGPLIIIPQWHWYIVVVFRCECALWGWAGGGWGRRRQQQRLVVCRRVETWKTASRPVGVRPPKKVVRRRSFLGGNRNNSNSNSVPFHPPGAVYYCVVVGCSGEERRKNGQQHTADTRPITR